MKINYKKERQLNLQIAYDDKSNDAFLKQLKEYNDLETLIEKGNGDFQNILRVISWVSSRWEDDASILKKGGKTSKIFRKAIGTNNPRGIEYSYILKACLRSLGYTIRTIFLESKDRKDLKKGEKHIFFEIYLSDQEKWFLIDPQFDIIIKKNGVPLNAVEFQQVLLNEEELEIDNSSDLIDSIDYLEWIGPYLFYFTTSLNNGRISLCDRISGNKKRLILVPINENPPRYFKNLMKMRISLVTHSITDFYPQLNN
ncbi:hypothetical protein G3I01_03825 [Gramella sp. MT6]|uniref:transglutaminase domain-containing protein n=1 Tax=Gramella sp. MT6 TaxID=2705471 RepID=UPI001C5FA331|nr:transglutaminase domain-containing protein [Gramella sp. MT6]QYA24673.1 hypothetical protein G3I01_03825 [Gramella sp. MT6]